MINKNKLSKGLGKSTVYANRCYFFDNTSILFDTLTIVRSKYSLDESYRLTAVVSS